MSQAETILEIKDLCVEFQTVEGVVHAVDHLNYTLHKGEKLGIVGESGSGKSVSSLGMMQLIPNPPGRITGGEILYHGKDLVKASEKEMQKIRGNEISMIFQEPMTSLNPIIKCGKQIAESLRLHRGMKKKEAMEEAVRMMRAVGIANPEVRAHEYPHQMSGGMRQRVMIAMALACQPQILIADEPTTALDVTIQAQILDLIRELNESMGTSVVFITHDLGVVSELCDTVIVMYTGHIVEQAPVKEPFEIHGLKGQMDVDARIEELMHLVGLDTYHLSRYPHELSGGQKQRIGIARALALEPDIIICDEAVSALDVSVQAQVLNLLQELKEKLGLTYFFISHNLNVVYQVSDRVGVMYLGKMVEIANYDQLYEKRYHPYTEALLSAIPQVGEGSVKRIHLEGEVPSPSNPPTGCRFHTRCPKACDRCKTEVPELREVEAGHYVACHLYDGLEKK